MYPALEKKSVGFGVGRSDESLQCRPGGAISFELDLGYCLIGSHVESCVRTAWSELHPAHAEVLHPCRGDFLCIAVALDQSWLGMQMTQWVTSRPAAAVTAWSWRSSLPSCMFAAASSM